MSLQSFPFPPPRGGPVLQEDGTFKIIWQRFFGRLASVANDNLAVGVSGTVTLAKLTVGGTNGSLTFVNGIITAVVAPT